MFNGLLFIKTEVLFSGKDEEVLLVVRMGKGWTHDLLNSVGSFQLTFVAIYPKRFVSMVVYLAISYRNGIFDTHVV